MFPSVINLELLVSALLLVSCRLHCTSAEAQRIDPEIKKEIDDFVTNVFLPSGKFSKLGLAIVKDNDGVLHGTGYGLADEEKGIPIGNETQFLIGSTTKSLTATLAVKVLSEAFPNLGETVLDTPIRNLMPSANFTLADRIRSEQATFRDLLAHRMCLFRDDLQILAEPFSSTAEIIYRQRYAKEVCDIRSSFQYNSQMYVIVAELIGMLVKKSYPELMDDFLKEMGMHNSALVSKSDDFSKMPFRAKPHYILNGVSHPMNPELITRLTPNAAAGGLYVPPNDMVQYMRLHLNKGRLDGKQIIPENVMSWLTRPSNTNYSITEFKTAEDDLTVTTFGYGLAMMLASYEGYEYNHHGGNFPPYRTLMSLFPSQNLGIFTSSNESPNMGDQKVLHVLIFELLRGTKNATEKVTKMLHKSQAKALEKSKKKEKILMELLKESVKNAKSGDNHDPLEILGKYGSGSSGDVEVTMRFDPKTNSEEMYVKYGMWYRGWMKQVAGSIYKIEWDTDVKQEYYAVGFPDGSGHARVENDTFQFIYPVGDEPFVIGNFRKGTSLEKFPIVPWDDDKCKFST